MSKISKKKINYCKEGNFFWVKWKENPKDNYELIESYHLFDEMKNDEHSSINKNYCRECL